MNRIGKQSLLQPLHEYHGAALDQLAGWTVPLSYGKPGDERETCLERVGVLDLSAWGRVTVEGRGAAGAVSAAVGEESGAAGFDAGGLAVGAGAYAGGTGVYRLRDDQYFLHLRPDGDRSLPGRLRSANLPDGGAETLVTTTDMSHGWCQIGVIGPNGPALLSRLCGLDFHDRAFPDRTAKRSSVAKTVQLVVRHDLATHRFYSLVGDRSLSPYLWKTAFQAAQGLDAAPIGLKTLQMLAVRHPVFRVEGI